MFGDNTYATIACAEKLQEAYKLRSPAAMRAASKVINLSATVEIVVGPTGLALLYAKFTDGQNAFLGSFSNRGSAECAAQWVREALAN